MSNVADNLSAIKSRLPQGVTLVAVSKFKPVELIMEAYSTGHRDFGENRPQELKEKMATLPKDIKWHFIGHLQTNKIKYIIKDVYLIESVDSLRLLEAINLESLKYEKVTNCLLQLHIATEESKQGMSDLEIISIVDDKEKYKGVRICGLMGMASFSDDFSLITGEFLKVKNLFDKLKQEYFADDPHFSVLSAGMSGDYKIAIENGSNNIRIGSAIFGSR